MQIYLHKHRKSPFIRGAALASPSHIARPVSVEGIQSEVRRCVEEGERLRVAGGGTAANALWGTDENLLTLDHFTGIESADPERARVWVRAGTKLGYLAQWLSQSGLALPMDGWPAAATVGGAISVGAHGSGPHLRNLSAHVTAVGLITADGVFRKITAAEDPDLLSAASLSLGGLGVVSHVELACEPVRAQRIRVFKSALEDTLDRLPELRAKSTQLSFEWFPGLKATRIRSAVSTEAPARRPSLDASAREWFMRNAGHWALAEVTDRLPFLVRSAHRLALAALPEADSTNAGPTPAARPIIRNLRLWEAQISVTDLPDALLTLERLLNGLELRAFAALEVGFVAADDVWLSPAYQRDTAFIRLKEYRGVDLSQMAKTFHDVLDRYDARPAWGSPHGKEGEELCKLYPKWNEFLALRARLDPRGTFLNSYLSSVFGVPVV